MRCRLALRALVRLRFLEGHDQVLRDVAPIRDLLSLGRTDNRRISSVVHCVITATPRSAGWMPKAVIYAKRLWLDGLDWLSREYRGVP